MKAKWLAAIGAAIGVLTLAGCTTVGPGGQMQRDPTGRAIWSFVIPGLGQFMNNEAGKGVLMMGANVVNNLYLRDSEDIEQYNERFPTAMAIGLVVSTWSAVDAYSVAQKLNMGQPLGRMYRSSQATEGRPPDPCRPAPAELEVTPSVCLDLLNKRLLASMSYRF